MVFPFCVPKLGNTQGTYIHIIYIYEFSNATSHVLIWIWKIPIQLNLNLLIDILVNVLIHIDDLHDHQQNPNSVVDQIWSGNDHPDRHSKHIMTSVWFFIAKRSVLLPSRTMWFLSPAEISSNCEETLKGSKGHQLRSDQDETSSTGIGGY